MRSPLLCSVVLILLNPPPAVTLARAPTLAPALPFEDWGACPFECCAYREWIASKATSVRTGRSRSAPVAFRVRPGESVEGLTGVVVTLRAGRLRAQKSMTLESQIVVLNPEIGHTIGTTGAETLALRPRDVVYLLHYEGEGASLYWYGGALHSGVLDSEDRPAGTPPAFVVEGQVRYVWWIQVRNKHGQVGWTDETEHFDHMDACAD